jgi:hypothetical protein
MKILILILFLSVLRISTAIEVSAALPVVKLPNSGQTTCYATDSSTGVVLTTVVTNCFNSAIPGVIGQDGNLKKGVPFPVPRFAVNSDNTVTDFLTGLVWSRDANPDVPGVKSWQASLDSVVGLNNQSYLGYSDWRLPNRKELMSLVNWGEVSSVDWLISQGFNSAGLPSGYYWSSSTLIVNSASAWYVYLYPVPYLYPITNIINANSKTRSTANVLPVRGGEYWTLGSADILPGSTFFGVAGGTRKVLIRNSGASAETFTGIGFTGPDAARFSVAAGGGAPACASLMPILAPGESCTVMVSALPALSRAVSANLTFSTAAGSQDIPFSMNAYSTVRGVITSQATGLPLAGATVTLVGSSLTAATDTSGAFDFGPLAAGTYSISVALTGYQALAVNNLIVSASQSGTAAVSLIPAVLTVSVAGTGSGTVTSAPAGISCAGSGMGTVVTCPGNFPGAVNLFATPSSLSVFGGWGGGLCSGLGACAVTMNGDQGVTASFNTATLLHIGGTEFATLQAAYNAAFDRNVIQLLQNTVTGSLNANRAVSVKIMGGYDASYISSAGVTTVTAPLTISQGSVVIGKIAIR